MKSAALIIFIKNPEAGRVKTRLAETVGKARALEIYRLLLAHTRRVALAVGVDRLLFYSRYIDLADEWPAAQFQKFRQEGADLGARMANAFERTLQHYQKAILIGSDCAELTPAILHTAFRRLDGYDLVLGPAVDGGYYLIGMRQPAPALFRQMTWSTADVLAETMRRAEGLGKSCYRLPELADVDTEADWERVRLSSPYFSSE